MARSVFAVVLLVCALVATTMAAVDSITLTAPGTITTAGSWTQAGATYTYTGANPVSISVSGTFTAANTIQIPASIAVTVLAATGTASNVAIAFTGASGSFTLANSITATFGSLNLNTGSTLSIPAGSSLTIGTTVAGSPSTVSVLGTLNVPSVSWTSIATPTFGAATIIQASGAATLGFTGSVTLPVGSSISTSSGALAVTTVGGTLAGTITSSSGGSVSVGGVLTSALSITGTLSSSAGGIISVANSGNQALTINGALSTSGAVSIVPTTTQAVSVTGGSISAGAAGITVTANGATSTSVAGTLSTTGPVAVSTNSGSATVSATTSATTLSITSSAASAVVTLSGAATLSAGLTLAATNGAGSSIVVSSAVTGATTVAFNTPGSISIASGGGSITFSGAQTLTTTPASINIAGSLLGGAASSVSLTPSAAVTISGTVTSGNGANSLVINAGAASTVSGTVTSASNIVFGSVAGAFGSTTYTINGGTLNFGTSVYFNSPTVFNGVTFVTPQWTTIVSGGSNVAGPSSQYTLTAAGNTINSNLFPSGSNTNCVFVQGTAAVSSFLVSLPGNIKYRNYVQSSSSALQVTSTNGGTVSFCTPLITSTLDRRNDIYRNNLVYFGGNVVYYFTTSAALPFGTITASDFTVTGGVITSLSAITGSSPTAYQIVVQITCDGVVNLAYNGSWTGTGTYLGEVTTNNVRVVSAKCISNIYAPCS